MAKIIQLDNSAWKYGYFHVLRTDFGSQAELVDLADGRLSLGYDVRIALPESDFTWLESVTCDREDKFECEQDRSHLTGYHVVKETFDVFAGTQHGIVPSVASPGVFVSQEVGDGLVRTLSLGSPLTAVLDSDFNGIQGEWAARRDILRLPEHEVWGSLRYSLENGEVPVCPCCGTGISCTGCKHVNRTCPTCLRRNVRVQHETPNGEDFVWKPSLQRGVCGRMWNGQEIAGDIISSRALRFLESIHAAPYFAEAIPVDASGMSEEMISKLEKVR